MSFFSRNTKPIVEEIPNFLEYGQHTMYTPDVAVLQRRTDWFLFVPDTMMLKHRDHLKLGCSAFKMLDAISEDKFTFWKKDLGEVIQTIPLTERFGHTPYANIRGEAFLVKPQTLFRLDTERKNGIEFIRKRVKLKIPYRKVLKVQVTDRAMYEWAINNTDYHEGQLNAWMYQGNPEYWSDLIDGGYSYTPVKSFTPNNPRLEPYYYFTIGEYDRTISQPRTVLRMR